MNGTEKIIAHIRSDAQAQCDGILAEAEEKARVIRADYEAKAKEAYTSAIRAGTRECGERADSMERMAQMEARKGILAMKQEMVSKCFSRAEELLTELPEEQYVSFLARLAADASVSGTEEIVLNARDRAAVGQAVVSAANARKAGSAMTLSPDTGDFAGGLILRRGQIATNCTAELLVELCRSDMSAQLAQELFK